MIYVLQADLLTLLYAAPRDRVKAVGLGWAWVGLRIQTQSKPNPT